MPLAMVRDLVERHVQRRQFGFLVEERVNVLLLNMDLDRQAHRHVPTYMTLAEGHALQSMHQNDRNDLYSKWGKQDKKLCLVICPIPTKHICCPERF
jgi:hypothetical protein